MPRPKRFKKCCICGKEFFNTRGLKRFEKQVTCSRECYSKNETGKPRPWRKKWTVTQRLSISEAQKRRFENAGPEKHPSCKGGTGRTRGYIWEWVSKGKIKLQHRVIMERFLGRPLWRHERVHHINGIKSDNRLENLMLLPNQSAHIKIHCELKKAEKKGLK